MRASIYSKRCLMLFLLSAPTALEALASILKKTTTTPTKSFEQEKLKFSKELAQLKQMTQQQQQEVTTESSSSLSFNQQHQQETALKKEIDEMAVKERMLQNQVAKLRSQLLQQQQQQQQKKNTNLATKEEFLHKEVVNLRFKLGEKKNKQQPWDAVSVVPVQGGSLRTWAFNTPQIERVQVVLQSSDESSSNKPLAAAVELWQGASEIPQTVQFSSTNGNKRPFCAVIETPSGQNVISVRNRGESPVTASLEAEVEDAAGNGSAGLGAITKQLLLASSTKSTTAIGAGGAVFTKKLDAAVASVQVLLRTCDGQPICATIELVQDGQQQQQVMEVYTENGLERPFFAIIETPATNNVVQIVNTATTTTPGPMLQVTVEPYRLDLTGGSSTVPPPPTRRRKAPTRKQSAPPASRRSNKKNSPTLTREPVVVVEPTPSSSLVSPNKSTTRRSSSSAVSKPQIISSSGRATAISSQPIVVGSSPTPIVDTNGFMWSLVEVSGTVLKNYLWSVFVVMGAVSGAPQNKVVDQKKKKKKKKQQDSANKKKDTSMRWDVVASFALFFESGLAWYLLQTMGEGPL